MSAQSILTDVDNSTFLIGALPKESFLLVYQDNFQTQGYSGFLTLASTMTWVENSLNLTNSYYKVTSSEGDQFEYLVPFPSGLKNTMKAYWTTDVIVLDPSCSWQTATMSTLSGKSNWNVTIPKPNLSFLLGNTSLGMFILSSNVFILYSISASGNINITQVSVIVGSNNSQVPIDGSAFFLS